MIVPVDDAGGARVKCPTPEEYAVAHLRNPSELRRICSLYANNTRADPRPEWQEKWRIALERFDMELMRQGVIL